MVNKKDKKVENKNPHGVCTDQKKNVNYRWVHKIITGENFKKGKGKGINFKFFSYSETLTSTYTKKTIKEGLNIACHLKRCKDKLKRLQRSHLRIVDVDSNETLGLWGVNYVWDVEIPDDASLIYSSYGRKIYRCMLDKVIIKNRRNIWEDEKLTLNLLLEDPYNITKTKLRTKEIIKVVTDHYPSGIRYLEEEYITEEMRINAIREDTEVLDTIKDPTPRLIMEACKTLNFPNVWFDPTNTFMDFDLAKTISKNEQYKLITMMCNNRDNANPKFFNQLAMKMKIERAISIVECINNGRWKRYSDSLNFILTDPEFYDPLRIFNGRICHRKKQKNTLKINFYDHLKGIPYAVGHATMTIYDIMKIIAKDYRLFKYINVKAFMEISPVDFGRLKTLCRKNKIWNKNLERDIDLAKEEYLKMKEKEEKNKDVYSQNNKKKPQKRTMKKINSIKKIKNPSKSILKAFVTSGFRNIGKMENQTEELCLIAIKKFPHSISHINNITMKIFKEAMKVQYPSQIVRNIVNITEEMMIYAVERNGLLLSSLKEPTEKVIRCAIKQNPMAIQFVKKPSLDIQYLALKESVWAIKYVNHQDIMEKYGKTREDKLKMLKANGSLIFLMDKPDQEMMMIAVKSDGYAIKFIDYPSEELCIEAVKQNPLSMIYMDLFQSEKLCREAFKQNKHTMFLFHDEYQTVFLDEDYKEITKEEIMAKTKARAKTKTKAKTKTETKPKTKKLKKAVKVKKVQKAKRIRKVSVR